VNRYSLTNVSDTVLLRDLRSPLSRERADELFAAAMHQSRAGIERLIAERFPRPDLPGRIEDFAPSPTLELSAPGRLVPDDDQSALGLVQEDETKLAPEPVKFIDTKLQFVSAVESLSTAGSRVAPRPAPAAAAAEVVPWLRALGLRADEARRAAARCELIPDAPLDARVRHALSGLARPPCGCAPYSRTM
jgi:hypothetical protein